MGSRATGDLQPADMQVELPVGALHPGLRSWVTQGKSLRAEVVGVPHVDDGEFLRSRGPAIPDAQRAAMARMVRGHAAKLHVPLTRRPATSAVLDVARRFWCWTATDISGEVQPVAHCFSGSAPALAGLGVAHGSADWMQALATLRPDLWLAGDGALLSTWDDDPWATFAYAGFGAASEPDDERLIRAPLGRVAFAGEHTAGAWAGLMEGALRSGQRAADEVHAAR